jgi:hypothetical protein
MILPARKLLLIALAALFIAPRVYPGQTSRTRTTPSSSRRATDPTIPPGTEKHPMSAATAQRPPGASLTRDQQERFLAAARVTAKKQISEGTTHPWRVTMTDGHLTHDAHVQQIDIFKPIFRGREGTVERNFHDSWKYNVAAYRLDKLLGLNMIPATIERTFENRTASFTWWVDDVWMDEATRRDNKIKPPTADFWTDQLNKVRVFDQLIANTDRNQGNLLIGHDWRLWIIDHTRAFRTTHSLLRPDVLSRCDQTLLDRMRKLDRGVLGLSLSSVLTPEEIDAILARRDIIVHFFESEIRDKGEDAVLTGIPRKTPQVSVP